jgi:hypothetical protein
MLRIVIIRSLIVLLGMQLTVPAALWHGLDHHHDSVDCAQPVKGLRISEEHVHCLALDLVLAVSSIEFPSENTVESGRVVSFGVFTQANPLLISRTARFLRGPPQA